MTAREYLDSLEHLGIKLGLTQITALAAALGRPDRACRTVLVAGTNGKGSVAAMAARGLEAAGHRTGRYTSPHLIDLEERFVIDGRAVSPAALEAAAARVRRAAGALSAPPSFFEATTAVAFELFREAGVEVAVLEVGLGGRLDATNIVSPAAAAITAIDFDHEAILGHTLEAIAAEKAGIVKPGAPVVLARNPPPVRDVVARAAAACGVPVVYAPDGVRAGAAVREGRTTVALATPVRDYGEVRLALRGAHQVDNAVTAVRLLETLDADVGVPAAAVRTALEDVEWPGRLELVRHPAGDVLLDGAHNPAGARALAVYLAATWPDRVPVVFGAMRDKAVDAMLAALAPAASVFLCAAVGSPRALAPGELTAAARRVAPGVEAVACADVDDAIGRGRARGAPVVVAGSLYLVGAARARLRRA